MVINDDFTHPLVNIRANPETVNGMQVFNFQTNQSLCDSSNYIPLIFHYPLVNIKKNYGKIHHFVTGKINYFDWVIYPPGNVAT